MKVQCRGVLWAARRARHQDASSSCVTGLPGAGLTNAATCSPPVVVGHPDDGHVRDCRVGVQELLDLPGVDVLATAGDHLFEAADLCHRIGPLPAGGATAS